MIDPILFFLFFAIYCVGFAAGAYAQGRYYNRKLKRELYDFDKDKREFDEWVHQRMMEIKAEQER